ncbi:hypothetical protein COCON_G00114220 [Conger conger]|uniref:Uncharacterized protein n=1 Tax=Conger conger TaxID=82655 RepID=A0A9Q1DGA8_CONCO|nr:hypothetical protein COCON_G00114220 [Conger conger]
MRHRAIPGNNAPAFPLCRSCSTRVLHGHTVCSSHAGPRSSYCGDKTSRKSTPAVPVRTATQTSRPRGLDPEPGKESLNSPSPGFKRSNPGKAANLSAQISALF